ncbi:MAG: usg protein [Alphaproteobacteria bacterium]
MSDFEDTLKGYRLTTVEIVYHLPDHPNILQVFIWQLYDIAPSYPRLKKFLDFWSKNIEGSLHSIKVAGKELITPSDFRFADAYINIQ